MRTIQSTDGTIKLEFSGYHAVLIPQHEEKMTLCISSQSGCAIDCLFCYTGKMGFKRNLSSAEIVEQFESALDQLRVSAFTKKNKESQTYPRAHSIITALVFMGMGEPLNNLSAVLEAIETIHHNYDYPYTKITVSTIGLPAQMKKMIDYAHPVHLALSLHSAIQQKRDVLIPSQKSTRIETLVEISNEYNKTHKQKMMIEYIVIAGFNDTPKDLDAIISLGLSSLSNFNLIPLNGTVEIAGKDYFSSSKERILELKNALRAAGYKCFIRRHKGKDIEAACGMLSQV